MDKRLEELFKKMETIDTCKLSKTVPVKNIENNDLREFIEKTYNSPDPYMNRIGSILNALVCQHRITFLMSRRIASDLVREDSNHTFKGLNYSAYNYIIAMLITEYKMFRRLREPTKQQAGVLELIEPALLEMMYISKGREYYEAQKANTLDLYDKYEDASEGKRLPEQEPKKRKSFEEVLAEDTDDKTNIESAITDKTPHKKSTGQQMGLKKEKRDEKGKMLFN